nr:MAG TPA: hypothetical protein [Crassvirales sp.]
MDKEMYEKGLNMINSLVGDTVGAIITNMVSNRIVIIVNNDDKDITERFKISYMFFFMQLAEIVAKDMKDVESGAELYGILTNKILTSIKSLGGHISNAADNMLNLSAEEINALVENIKDVKHKMNNESNNKDENDNDALEDLDDSSFDKVYKAIFNFFVNK